MHILPQTRFDQITINYVHRSHNFVGKSILMAHVSKVAVRCSL